MSDYLSSAPNSKGEQLRRAIHECGHAVVATLCEIPVKEIFVSERNDRESYCCFEDFPAPKSSADWSRHAVIAAAGLAAEEALLGHNYQRGVKLYHWIENGSNTQHGDVAGCKHALDEVAKYHSPEIAAKFKPLSAEHATDRVVLTLAKELFAVSQIKSAVSRLANYMVDQREWRMPGSAAKLFMSIDLDTPEGAFSVFRDYTYPIRHRATLLAQGIEIKPLAKMIEEGFDPVNHMSNVCRQWSSKQRKDVVTV
jgi:hypothetical protein